MVVRLNRVLYRGGTISTAFVGIHHGISLLSFISVSIVGTGNIVVRAVKTIMMINVMMTTVAPMLCGF